jgi:hypothetical protein
VILFQTKFKIFFFSLNNNLITTKIINKTHEILFFKILGRKHRRLESLRDRRNEVRVQGKFLVCNAVKESQ